MEQKYWKKWFWGALAGLLGFLAVWLLVMVTVDPYFHYHAPLSCLSYRLYEERYINDGIARNFDYDAAITGTSMTQNFKTSELDALYGVKSVKLPFSGAGFDEICRNLDRGLSAKEKRGQQVRMAVIALDYNGLRREWDWKQYDDFPSYLYDDDFFNDVSYVWNKSILYKGAFTNLLYTLAGTPSTSFDAYSAWEHATGLEEIFKTYQRTAGIAPMQPELSAEEKEMVAESMEKNFVALANAHPDTTFYLFYTPYSILYWENLYRTGELMKQTEAEQIATQLLLACPNIRLYSFSEKEDVICDLDYYRDKEHYSAEINSAILEWMRDDAYLLTPENAAAVTARERSRFTQFDYDSIYAMYGYAPEEIPVAPEAES